MDVSHSTIMAIVAVSVIVDLNWAFGCFMRKSRAHLQSQPITCQYSEFRLKQKYTEIKQVSYHHCKMSCYNNEDCVAFEYKSHEKSCFMYTKICPVVEFDAESSFTLLDADTDVNICAVWVDGDPPGKPNRAVYSESKVRPVARANTGNNILVGQWLAPKWSSNNQSKVGAVFNEGIEYFTGDFQHLKIGERCTAKWVPASVGQTPRRAVVLSGPE